MSILPVIRHLQEVCFPTLPLFFTISAPHIDYIHTTFSLWTSSVILLFSMYHTHLQGTHGNLSHHIRICKQNIREDWSRMFWSYEGSRKRRLWQGECVWEDVRSWLLSHCFDVMVYHFCSGVSGKKENWSWFWENLCHESAEKGKSCRFVYVLQAFNIVMCSLSCFTGGLMHLGSTNPPLSFNSPVTISSHFMD